jgi:hypothetical protein
MRSNQIIQNEAPSNADISRRSDPFICDPSDKRVELVNTSDQEKLCPVKTPKAA